MDINPVDADLTDAYMQSSVSGPTRSSALWEVLLAEFPQSVDHDLGTAQTPQHSPPLSVRQERAANGRNATMARTTCHRLKLLRFKGEEMRAAKQIDMIIRTPRTCGLIRIAAREADAGKIKAEHTKIESPEIPGLF